MDALVGGEVKGTFSRSLGFGLALPRAQTDQAGGKDLADLVQALGGGHAVGIERVGQAGDAFMIAAPLQSILNGAFAWPEGKRKSVFMQLFEILVDDQGDPRTARAGL